MNTEELKELGLTDEQIKGVMAAHGKVVNPLKEQVTNLSSERDSAKDQLKTVTGQLDQIQKDHKGDADLKAEIDSLKETNAKVQKDAEAALAQTKLEGATKLALTQAGALNVKAAEALLNKEELKLDDKGNVAGLEDQLKALKESDDSKFLFKPAADPQDKPKAPNITTPGNPNPDPAGGNALAGALGIKSTN